MKAGFGHPAVRSVYELPGLRERTPAEYIPKVYPFILMDKVGVAE